MFIFGFSWIEILSHFFCVVQDVLFRDDGWVMAGLTDG